MIYVFDELEAIDDLFVEHHKHLMPKDRQQMLNSYINQKDKKLCLISYLLLVYALREEWGISGEIKFKYHDNGKPYLTDYPKVHFSISHCCEAAVCAVSDSEVGVDVEAYGAYDHEAARLVCTKDELNALKYAADKAKMFCRFWVEKESRIKCTGEGLSGICKSETYKTVRSFCFDRYALAICVKDSRLQPKNGPLY